MLESEPDRRVDAARTGRALLADAFGFLLFRIEINRERRGVEIMRRDKDAKVYMNR